MELPTKKLAFLRLLHKGYLLINSNDKEFLDLLEYYSSPEVSPWCKVLDLTIREKQFIGELFTKNASLV